MNKLTPKFLLASMKLLINSENHFSKPLQRPYSGYFDPENAYGKPPIILKIVVWKPAIVRMYIYTVLWRNVTKCTFDVKNIYYLKFLSMNQK
jgi:hypothetical protein